MGWSSSYGHLGVGRATLLNSSLYRFLFKDMLCWSNVLWLHVRKIFWSTVIFQTCLNYKAWQTVSFLFVQNDCVNLYIFNVLYLIQFYYFTWLATMTNFAIIIYRSCTNQRNSADKTRNIWCAYKLSLSFQMDIRISGARPSICKCDYSIWILWHSQAYPLPFCS